ncbi:FAD-binding oxidoreductase [Streptosporangium sp. NPDC000396]|uniref:FAD-binding oxidoreductase n=1 Tax=Streptosporangium sp. NPDC000396 TaxID=3366185 RepID=UPI0036BC4D5B
MPIGRGEKPMSIEVETLSGGTTTLDDEKLEELRMTFRGPLLSQQDDGYDESRVVYNGMVDRRPALIVRCSGTADVIDAVNLAREHGLLTAVRGGGHSVAGHSVHDRGLLIDLSGMRGVWVDPDSRVVRVQGGATWGDVDREAQAFGLAVPGGVVSTTGVAGLTLGGGYGWLHRKYGLSCDNLRAVEIVTADGRLLRASESENEDLFWGLRGGGGNFGVVTAFEFTAHALGPIVMCAATMYGESSADEVFRAWRDWAETVPDEVTTRAIFWTAPEDPHMPPQVQGRQVLLTAAMYAGPPDEGERILQPVRQFATPLVDLSGQMPYRMFQSVLDFFFVKGELSSYWKSLFMNELGDRATDLIVKHGLARTTPQTMVHVPLLGGAVNRVGQGDTAFGDRGAHCMLSVDGNWVDHNSAEHIAWVRHVISEAEELSTGASYLNFDSDAPEKSPDLVSATFGENLQRLTEIKKRYDPQNLFRLNANIAPA